MIFETAHTDQKPWFIGHRGYTPVAPENSLVSFEAAGKKGVWAIETDVHRTKDGVLVCCHDSSTLRMYGTELLIEETDFSELKKLHFSSGNGLEKYDRELLRMPTFEEYLNICMKYKAVPFIETKGMVVEAVLRVLKDRGILEQSVLSSISFEHIEEARKLERSIFVHHIFSDEEKMERLAELGYAGVSYNYPDLDQVPEGLIERTHKAGVRVCLRAGDQADVVLRMMQMGLDYIPSNRLPELPDVFY